MKSLYCRIGYGLHPFPYDEQNARIELTPIKNGKIRVLPVEIDQILAVDQEEPEILVYKKPLDLADGYDIEIGWN